MIDFLKTLLAFACLMLFLVLLVIGSFVGVVIVVLGELEELLKAAVVYLDRRSRL